MLPFYAKEFLTMIEGLVQAKADISRWAGSKTPTEEEYQALIYRLGILQSHLKGLSFQCSMAHMPRILQTIKAQTVHAPAVNRMLDSLKERIEDDLNERVFFCVKPELTGSLFQNIIIEENEHPRKTRKSTRDVFGVETIETLFAMDDYDPSEAINCLICGRATACVFHLMRMMEIGLGSLGAIFKVSLAHTNWGSALGEIQTAINGMNKTEPWKSLQDLKDRQEAYSQAASHFDTIKTAWRNYTAHARGKFTEEEADLLFQNVKEFLAKTSSLPRRFPIPLETQNPTSN